MLKKVALILALTFLGGNAHAVSCGTGINIDLKEGGWNQDCLAIRLSRINSQGDDQASLKSGSNGAKYVWFRGLTQSRLDGVRRSASLTFAMGATVWTYSHNGSCQNATELSVLDC